MALGAEARLASCVWRSRPGVAIVGAMRPLLFSAMIVAIASACSRALEPLPLAITLDATPSTAATDDSITFVVGAQGGQLFGVEIDFGDTSTDQYATSGARTARVTFRHAYASAGTFTVRAVVTDARAGQKEASAEVTIH